MNDKQTEQAAAVILGGFLAVNTKPDFRLWILAFLIWLIVGICALWRPQDFVAKMIRPYRILLAFGLLVGFIYGISAEKAIIQPLEIPKVTLEGKLQEWIIDEDVGKGVFINNSTEELVESQSLDGQSVLGEKYSIRVYAESKEKLPNVWKAVKPGDRIRITGKLEHPKPPGTAGEFDLPLYNAVRGLSGSIIASEVVLLEEGSASIPWKIRQKVRSVLNASWPDQAGVLEGILFGDSRGISTEQLEVYKRAGVMHVFAASGANVAFVIALVWTILFWLPARLRILATISIIILYAVLCGGNPPILRATILGVSVLLGRFGKGKIPSLRWLMFAGVLLFLYNPLYLKDGSFQLSFAATWGVIVLSPHIANWHLLKKLPQLIHLPLAVTLGAQIAVLPIMIVIFHRLSIAGFFTNIFMLGILGAVLQMGLLGMIFMMIPFLSIAFFQAAFWLLEFATAGLTFFANSPWAYFWVLNPGKLFWVVWYGFLAIMLLDRAKIIFIAKVQIRKVKKLLDKTKLKSFKDYISVKIVISVLVCLLIVFGVFYANRQESFRITFLDVGQGDCILIQTKKENLMIDTGPRGETFDSGERILVPYLMERRISHLDMLFITHEHQDHIGGAKYLLSNIPVEIVCVPEVGDRLYNDEWQEGLPAVLSSYPNTGENLICLKAGDQLEFSSGLKLEVLGPISTLEGTNSDANNNSLVLSLDYLGKKLLLTGDMEKDEMDKIWQRGVSWDADFLKIPHHGSKGSCDPYWFDQMNPLAVFIQVGKNRFGHPSSEVINYWQERQVPIYRTDQQGTIDLEITKDGYRLNAGRKQ